MALPSNTFTTYDSIGNREDLSDVIYDVSPTETPFVSAISRTTATAIYHEWQTDVLASASSTNAQLDGDDAAGTAQVPTVRLGNRCQIMRKVVVVSGTNRTVRKAGRTDELDYLTMKMGKELKRDVESALLSANPATAGSTATARLLGGVETWLTSNKLHRATTSTTPGLGATIVDGNAVTITTATQLKANIDTVIASCWTNGGDPTMILVSAAGKQFAASMTGIATNFRNVNGSSQATIIGGADVYVSNFGVHNIVPSRFHRDRTVLILDTNYWALAELRGMQTIPLAKTGDNDKQLIITEVTLEARNQAASGKVADIAWA